MLIDTHAHYSHRSFDNSFRFLTQNAGNFCISEGSRETVFHEMQLKNIVCSIEPGINLASNVTALELSAAYPGRVFPAIGLHPTRTFHEKWQDRKKLDKMAADPRVVAIGETGLDYHYERKEQHRLCQLLWFLYQLELARKRKLPLILHIRDAHKDAIRLLKWYPGKKNGGVVHCFNGDWETALKYVSMGYHIGIGGAVLQPEERAGKLWEAVQRIPLNRILVETDSPYVLPYCKDTLPPKLLCKTRNTSLILPAVIQKIAELKQLPAGEVEMATTQNAIALFSLPV